MQRVFSLHGTARHALEAEIDHKYGHEALKHRKCAEHVDTLQDQIRFQKRKQVLDE